MKEYNLEFNMFYLNADNFKEKNARILVATIANARLNDFMKFSCFAHIDFDESDKKHQFPHVTEFEKYNRTKTNCIVYDLTDNANNQRYYDKCFIYRTNSPHFSTYGFVFYNSETGKCNHIYNIEEEYDVICVKLMQSFLTMFNKPLFDFYAKKYDCTKGRNGLTVQDTPGIVEYEKMKQYMDDMKSGKYETHYKKVS